MTKGIQIAKRTEHKIIMKGNKMNKIGAIIGPTKDAIDAARTGIMNILKSGQDQDTIRQALISFENVTKVNNATIMNSTFTNK